MDEVRVYLNLEEGPRWCAEDDRGFTGAADRLSILKTAIKEWAAEEGFAENLRIRLVPPVEPHRDPEPVVEVTPGSHVPTTVGGPPLTSVLVAA